MSRVRSNSDKYYGDVAKRYDWCRRKQPHWGREIELVSELATEGPVLDVPLGTGRFIPRYRDRGLKFEGLDISADMVAEAKKKHGQFPYRIGTVLDMPYKDQQFKTLVCVRLTMHLKPDELVRAFAEMNRVARTVVVSLHRKLVPHIESHDPELVVIRNNYLMAKYRSDHAGNSG